MCGAMLLAAAKELWIFEVVGGEPAEARGVASGTRAVRAAPVSPRQLLYIHANCALLC